MKILVAIFALSLNIQSFAAIGDNLKIYDQRQMAKVQKVTIQTRSQEAQSASVESTVIEISASVSFSNSCLASQAYLVTVSETSTLGHIEYTLETLDNGRACKIKYAPVTVIIPVATFHTDEMPVVTVNNVQGDIF